MQYLGTISLCFSYGCVTFKVNGIDCSTVAHRDIWLHSTSIGRLFLIHDYQGGSFDLKFKSYNFKLLLSCCWRWDLWSCLANRISHDQILLGHGDACLRLPQRQQPPSSQRVWQVLHQRWPGFAHFGPLLWSAMCPKSMIKIISYIVIGFFYRKEKFSAGGLTFQQVV